MSILPPNKMQETVDTPKNFFLYGATMSGKSYLAGEFPNPLFLDTDGNASANPYPSIELRNIRNKAGGFKTTVIDQLDKIILELQTTQHTYETIVLDVIDDIVVMIEQYITENAGVDSLGDIGYGRGHAAFNTIFQQLVIDLKALPVNVIYVSRISSWEENGIQKEEPSLKEKHVNIVNGNCDYMIQTKKIGRNYVRTVKAKRKNYDREKMDDERIEAILDTVTGAFEKTRRTDKKTQKRIIKRMEEKEQDRILDRKEEVTEVSPNARPKVSPEKTVEKEVESKPRKKAAPTQDSQPKKTKLTLDELSKKSEEAERKKERQKTEPQSPDAQGVTRSRKRPQL